MPNKLKLSFFKYAAGQQLSVIIRALQEYLIRVLIPPADLAIINLIMIISNTFGIFQLNICGAGIRKLSQMRGQGVQKRELDLIKSSAFHIEIGQQLFISCLLLIIAPLIWRDSGYFGYQVYGCAAAIMLLSGVNILLIGFHEGQSFFGRLGYVLPIIGLVNASSVLLGTYYFGIDGLIFGTILGFFISLFILIFSENSNFLILRPGAQTKAPTKSLIHSGAYLRATDIPTLLLYSLDTILAAIWLQKEELALYVTARLSVGFASQVVLAFSRVNLSLLGDQIGKKKKFEEIDRRITKQFCFVYLLLVPSLVFLFDILFRLAIPVLIPEYIGSLSCQAVLFFTILNAPRALFIRNFWIQTKNWIMIFKTGVFGLLSCAFILFTGRYFLNVNDILSFSILVFLSQVPYALLLLFYVGGTSRFGRERLYRLIAYFFSSVLIFIILFNGGSLNPDPQLDPVAIIDHATRVGAILLLGLVGYFLLHNKRN